MSYSAWRRVSWLTLTPELRGAFLARLWRSRLPRHTHSRRKWAGSREHRGERIIGFKVGCTSKPIQQQLGVQEPIFGRIFDTGRFHSGSRLSHASFANLAVEGELAVRLGNDLVGPAVSTEACREAIEAVFPVIELHHYVVPEAWPRCAVADRQQRHARGICLRRRGRRLLWLGELRAQSERSHQRAHRRIRA